MNLPHWIGRRGTMLILAGVMLCPIASVRAQHAAADPYANIGKAGSWWRCEFGNLLWNVDTCDGYSRAELFGQDSSADAGSWIKNVRFEPISTTNGRKGGAVVTVTSVRQARNMVLTRLKRNGAVIARLQIDPDGPAEDPVYKIGGKYTKGKGFTNNFYIVIDKYNVVINTNRDTETQSRKIANWRLYGLDTSGVLRAMQAHGAFRWCAITDSHFVTDLPLFASCKGRNELAKLEKRIGRDSLLRRLKNQQSSPIVNPIGDDKIVQDYLMKSTEEFASLPCGVGCCITEPAPEQTTRDLDVSASRIRTSRQYAVRASYRKIQR